MWVRRLHGSRPARIVNERQWSAEAAFIEDAEEAMGKNVWKDRGCLPSVFAHAVKSLIIVRVTGGAKQTNAREQAGLVGDDGTTSGNAERCQGTRRGENW